MMVGLANFTHRHGHQCVCVSQGSHAVGLFSREGVCLSTYPSGISNTRESLDRLTSLSDLCLVLHRAPQAPSLLASACASPLGKILSGLVYKKAAGDSYTYTNLSKRAISAEQSSKADRIHYTQ